jgi:elongator complex protein 4
MITLSQFHRGSRPAVFAQSDFAMALDSFATSMTLPENIRTHPHLTNEATGLVQIHRVARINSLIPSSVKLSAVLGAGLDRSLAFQVRRKRFSIETWHLPPDLEDVSPRGKASSESNSTQSRNSAGPVGGKKPCGVVTDF